MIKPSPVVPRWQWSKFAALSLLILLLTLVNAYLFVLLLAILARYRENGVDFHALRTRESGARRFVDLHVLVPGHWTIQRGHELAERLEHDIRQALPRCAVMTHLEPLEDPVSQEDIALDR